MEEDRIIGVSIVEDDQRIREALCAIVSSATDMRVLNVYGDAEAALADTVAARPDVCIMDINLPGASGIECVRALSARSGTTQFLMYSMHDDDRRVFDALKAGANGYLLKSAKPGEILGGVRELMAGGSPMSAQVARRVVAQLRPAQGAVPEEARLTDREQQILTLLAEGLLYKEISQRIGITEAAIKQHIHRMYAKLHVQNRTEAVNRYFGR